MTRLVLSESGPYEFFWGCGFGDFWDFWWPLPVDFCGGLDLVEVLVGLRGWVLAVT